MIQPQPHSSFLNSRQSVDLLNHLCKTCHRIWKTGRTLESLSLIQNPILVQGNHYCSWSATKYRAGQEMLIHQQKLLPIQIPWPTCCHLESLGMEGILG